MSGGKALRLPHAPHILALILALCLSAPSPPTAGGKTPPGTARRQRRRRAGTTRPRGGSLCRRESGTQGCAWVLRAAPRVAACCCCCRLPQIIGTYLTSLYELHELLQPDLFHLGGGGEGGITGSLTFGEGEEAPVGGCRCIPAPYVQHLSPGSKKPAGGLLRAEKLASGKNRERRYQVAACAPGRVDGQENRCSQGHMGRAA